MKCITHDLAVPASAEIVLEGHIQPDASDPTGYETAAEGPFGDHTGYYNEVERFPVFTIDRITMRRDPIYHSHLHRQAARRAGGAGRRVERGLRAAAAEAVSRDCGFLPAPRRLLVPARGRGAKKQYPGHAKRVMFGVWSFLRQFMYTKIIVVTDDDVNVRDWKEVIWAITTRVDPARDTLIVEHTPIDYLDFASPVSGSAARWGSTRRTSGLARRREPGARRSRWTLR